jgi:hypothetical protein
LGEAEAHTTLNGQTLRKNDALTTIELDRAVPANHKRQETENWIRQFVVGHWDFSGIWPPGISSTAADFFGV